MAKKSHLGSCAMAAPTSRRRREKAAIIKSYVIARLDRAIQ
jgi:hypothetical protein